MKTLLKLKWFVIIAWIAVLMVLVFQAPNMGELIRHQGQPEIPKGYPSAKADQILKHMHQMHHSKGKHQSKSTRATALVFYKKSGFTNNDYLKVQHAIQILKNHQNQLGIESIRSPFNKSKPEKDSISNDHTTLLVTMAIHLGDRSVQEEKSELYHILKPVKLDHYFTGNWLVQDDYITNTEKGLHRTEWITIVFILGVLLLVFRSVITPLIPLITVGITFLVSQSIIAFLAKWVHFPISEFTQIFLVAVLFGIGTDYCILLLNRFKEELPRHESVTDAILHTYKNAGRTMFFCGVAVLIGFSTIGTSTFSLYRSAVGVAIGVVVLMLALATIVPIFMQLLGTRLFWPSRMAAGHNESKTWGWLGRFAWARPLLSLLIVAAVTIPFVWNDYHHPQKNFNSMEEMGNSNRSVKGFHLMSKVIGPGETMPAMIIIQNDDQMDNRRDLEALEAITREVKQVKHVKSVRSVTQPQGKPIKDFLVPNQAQSLSNGLSKANGNIGTIAGNLAQAKNQLANSNPQMNQIVNGFGSLISGTDHLKSGVLQLKHGLQNIETGLNDSSSGAAQLQSGLTNARQKAEELSAESQTLLNGYQQMQSNLSQLQAEYENIQQGVKQMHDSLNTLDSDLQALGQTHPEVTNDPNYQDAIKKTKGLLASSDQMNKNLIQLNDKLGRLNSKMKQANSSFGKLVDGQKQFADQLQKAVSGITKLKKGLNRLAEGQQTAISKIPSITGGLNQINNNQKKLQNGFSQLQDQLSQLSNGLGKSVDGLHKVSSGLGDAANFLEQLSKENNTLSGFYIPKQALHNKQFQKSIRAYMSNDRKITTIYATFDVNPYSTQAINQIDQILKATNQARKGTPLQNAKVGIEGPTSTFHDLRQISNADYARTVLLMLIGIGLILFVFLRSFIMPIYILLSLVVTYFAAMGVTEFIYVHLLGYSGLNWAIPFFGFVMLIALGVDYSIFLLDRFNENHHLTIAEAIHGAMKTMGKVIISAAAILSGTFAAMIPSGVMSLVELATIIIAGLVIYNLFVLPLFIPVMVKIFGKANWWPFR